MAANTHSIDLELSSSQSLSIADASQTGLDITGNISIAAWIRLEQLPSTAGTSFAIASKDDGGIVRSYLMQINSANDKLEMYCWDAVNNLTRFSMDTAFVGGDVGNWIHIAATVTIASTSAVFYKNGAVSANTTLATAATSIRNTADDFVIGARDNSPYDLYFDGMIDEVVITSDVITAGEAANLYAGYDASTILDNIGGYWKLNNVLTDSSGNGNTLTNNGTATFSTTVPFANYYANTTAGGAFLLNFI